MFASRNSGICDCYCFWCFVVNIMSKKFVLRFTLKELNALIQDEKARVVLQRSIRKLPLQPYCLSDLQGSIHEALDANLAKFDHELKGILLSYKNIKIVKNIANVLYDDSRLYLTIQADFYLFMPEVGCVLRGIVNKRSADHIGCLVHKAFNVSIPRPECETDEDWQGYYVEIGQEVTFRVDSLDLTGSLPYMLGHLLDVGSSGPLSDTFEEQKTTEKKDIVASIRKFNGFLEQLEDPHASVHATEHKKKKKHQKYEDLESGVSVQDQVKPEKYDSGLEKDDQEHYEYGSGLKTPKKKKRKNTDQIAPIKQEEQAYRIDSERDTEYHNQQEEEQIDRSYHLAAFDHLSSTSNLKKKKRKYGEAFYDNNDDDANHTFSAQNESVKHKKKKSKNEKLFIEIPNAAEAAEGGFSIDTSQEITNQDKKKKKKKKRDVEEEISTGLRGGTEFHRTGDYESHMTRDQPLTTNPYINNTPEELRTEMQFSKEHFKKLGKKVKPLVTTELITSTPIEQKTKKENKFSDSISRSKLSVVTGIDSQSDFKQTNLLESVDHFSLMHSPILKAKHPKKEKESSPSIQSGTVPGKVKKLKKEKRLSSSQQSTDRSVSEDDQHSGSHHVFNPPESNLPWSDTEDLLRDGPARLSSSNSSLTNVEETKYKTKIRESAEEPNKNLIKNHLESPVESKVKMSKKESRLSIKKRDSIGSNVKRAMKIDSNTNNNDNHDDGNNSYDQLVAQCGESEKVQVSNRLIEHRENAKKPSPVTRKSFTPTMITNSSLALGGNMSEEGDSSDEDNVLKNTPKSSRTPSERSPKHSRVSSKTSRSLHRACTPDSGLSLSATSAEKESNNLTSRDSKREADSSYSTESPKDGRHVKEQGKILPKTPKRNKIADTEGSSGHLTIKHRIKKEKESPISQSSRHKIDSKSPLRGKDPLEAERMKILADVIKKLEDGNKEDLSMKDESHKLLNSSAVRARRQSKQEDNMPDVDLDTSKFKKLHERKESNKSKVSKSSIGETDNMQQLHATSYFKPSAEKLSSVSTALAGEKELDESRNSLGEGSPVKISGKTPRRKSTTGTEGNNSKPVTKTPVKIKEKESPKKRKVVSSPKSDNRDSSKSDDREEKSLEESAGAIADRLLEEFLKKTSL